MAGLGQGVPAGTGRYWVCSRPKRPSIKGLEQGDT